MTRPKRALEQRIVNGQEALSPIPWQVALQYTNSNWTFCGGSILDQKTVLTAAHCTFGDKTNDTSDWHVMVGATHAFEGQRVKIERVINHPEYQRKGLHNDLAIIKLSQPLELTENVQAICLPEEEHEYDNGADCFASGWGTTAIRKLLSKLSISMYFIVLLK